MSDNHLFKINLTILVRLAIFLVLIAIGVGNARFLIDNLLRSNEIDEKIVSEANPRLDRQFLNQAISVLDSFASEELTSIFPSATVENEAIEPGEVTEISVEIQNASGISGAAASLSEKLSQQGYKISTISTAPSIQNKTTIFYKTGYRAVAQSLNELLISEDWTIEIKEADEQISEIIIILGK